MNITALDSERLFFTLTLTNLQSREVSVLFSCMPHIFVIIATTEVLARLSKRFILFYLKNQLLILRIKKGDFTKPVVTSNTSGKHLRNPLS